MPRFLNTWTGEFEWYHDPKRVTYAALSHVWRAPNDGGEQSYDDVRKLQEAVNLWEGRSAASDTSPTEYHEESTIFAHPGLSDKIKSFCKVARSAGFRLAWNDACCINKSSSAELSEAINSMYEWYRLSDMCYVHLADVPDGDRPRTRRSKFLWSKWHRRGWTLQELIAPERVMFLTNTWHFLGTKLGLATTLNRITGVDVDILTGRATLDSVSVACRMSWAARRQTTRVEDEAYSLMGILGIHMSPIYGEGENAFLRLQEEIVKTVSDHTIFAWGDSRRMWSLANSDDRKGFGLHNPGLLASSPFPFMYSRDIAPITSTRLAQNLGLKGSEDVPPMHCIFTPEGVRIHLLCLSLASAPHVLDAFRVPTMASTCAECRQLGEVDTLAFLQCVDVDDHLIALPLCRSRRGGGDDRGFYIGTHRQCTDKNHEPYRTISLAKEALTEVLKYVQPTVVEVLLLRHYSHPLIPKSLQPDDDLPCLTLWPGGRPEKVVVDIAPHSIHALRAQGFVPSHLWVTSGEREVILETALVFTRGLEGSLNMIHTIELSLLLTKLEHLDTRASFSVKGVNFVGSRSNEPSLPYSSIDTSRDPSVSTPHIAQGTLNAADGSRASILHTYEPRRRTIVHAEYTIHSDSTPAFMIRLLRVALEFPFGCPFGPGQDTTNLWLSIEISEEFQHTLPPIESVMDNSLSGPTGDTREDVASNDPHERDNVASSSTHLPFPAGDENTRWTSRESIDALRKENDALRVQMQDMDLKMSAMLARLDTLTSSNVLTQGPTEVARQEKQHEPGNVLGNL